MDVIKVADYVIDIGREGGRNGGDVLFEGTPEDLLKCKKSFTAAFLKEEL
jgi:excinuclease ABC subunit A